MSECVVRMEMPEKCAECPAWSICGTLHKYMLGIDCDSDWTYDDLLVITVETGFVKPDNCPIICQLPEGHGRLVDADAYSAEMKDRQDAAWKWRNEAIAEEDELKLARAEGAFSAFVEAKLTWDKQVTIVPAERSEK